MKTKNDVKEWDMELHELAKSFGDGDVSAWLMAYGALKEKILDGCSLGRYSNGVSMSNSILKDFSGYEYLMVIFAKMRVLDDVMRGQIEKEDG